MLADCKFMRSIMFKSPDTSSALVPTLTPQITSWKAHNNVLRAYGILLCLAPILSSLLRVFNPNDFQLVSDMSWFATEILAMGEYSLPLRPLGASYMFLPLVSLWAATDEPIIQSKVQQMVSEFEKHFPLTRWMSGAYWLRQKYERLRLELVLADMEDLGVDDEIDIEKCECKVQ